MVFDEASFITGAALLFAHLAFGNHSATSLRVAVSDDLAAYPARIREMAEALGLTANHVKVLLHRARQRLRETLEATEGHDVS